MKLDNGKYAFIDSNGKLQDGRYKYAFSYSEGLAAVQLDDEKYAFIDRNGNLQPGRYYSASSYSEGFAFVLLDYDNYAFIDRNGNLQDGRYMDALSYREGRARVRLENEKRIYIDYDGNLYLSREEWNEHLSKSPEDYKLIPPHRFKDEDFIKEINYTMKATLSNYIKDVPQGNFEELKKHAEFVDKVMKSVEEKNKEVEQKLKEQEEENKKFDKMKSDILEKIKDLGGK